MVVSIVRWKHLSKQVGWVQLCNWFCNCLLYHVILSYTIVSRTDLSDHYWSFEQILCIIYVLKCYYSASPVWDTNLNKNIFSFTEQKWYWQIFKTYWVSDLRNHYYYYDYYYYYRMQTVAKTYRTYNLQKPYLTFTK